MLKSMDKERDLGVIVSRDLKPSRQCTDAAKKANQALGMIKRNITSRSPNILLRLYKSLVRPRLEYAVQAWTPWMRKDIDLLESVQRRFTRMINGMEGLTYQERLRCLRLPSLEARTRRGDAIET